MPRSWCPLRNIGDIARKKLIKSDHPTASGQVRVGIGLETDWSSIKFDSFGDVGNGEYQMIEMVYLQEVINHIRHREDISHCAADDVAHGPR